MEKINATAAADAGLEMRSIYAEAIQAPRFRYELARRRWTSAPERPP